MCLSTLIPAAAISGVGFAFKDYPDRVERARRQARREFAGQISKGGFVVLDKIWDNGFRMITNSVKPINHPDDLRGMKIRTPVSALWLSLFKSLGAAPTGLNFAEVYSALQTKVVDGQENPPAIISAAKLYEVQKFCSVTNHMWDGWWFLINRRAWSQVPTGMQETVTRIINATCMTQREDIAQQNISAAQRPLRRRSPLQRRRPDALPRQALGIGYYKEWRGKFGDEAWSLLEESGRQAGLSHATDGPDGDGGRPGRSRDEHGEATAARKAAIAAGCAPARKKQPMDDPYSPP